MKNKEFTLAIIVIVIFVVGYILFRAPTDSGVELSLPEGVITGSEMVPVTDGVNTFTFEGIDWLFEPQGIDTSGAPVTKVRIQFVGFKRGDVDITVLPYRLGNYRGDCIVLDSIESTVSEGETPLAFAECRYNDKGREFGIFQKDIRVIAKYRDIDVETSQMNRLTEIDLTTVVQ